MDDIEHLEFIQNIMDNQETLRKILSSNKPLSKIISETITHSN